MTRGRDRGFGAVRPLAPIALWVPLAALAWLAAALYARGFTVGLVGDDFTLLDAGLRVPLGELLSGQHGILGYYRPISRELYFWWWGRMAGDQAVLYHVVNALTYAATVALFHRFLLQWLGARVAILGAAVFVLFPPTGALLAWVSCAQDLIALFWGTAALVLYQSGRFGLAGGAVFLAALSKETAAIVPLVLAGYEWAARERVPLRDRVARLFPVFLGILAAVTIAVAVRVTWPPGTSVAVWSPRQMTGAWRLPAGFLGSWWPPDLGDGVAIAWRTTPFLLVAAALLATLVAPPRGEVRTRPGERTAPPRFSRALFLGLAWVVLGMVPVAAIVERWRGYFFSFAALGASVIAALLLARFPAAPVRVLLAVAAVVSFGANSHYRPVEASFAPARHPHVNYTFFRETADLSRQLLAALRPWCDSLRSVPRVYTLGVPPGITFENALGPGRRVTCRDTVARVRNLDRFEPPDAAAEFGILSFDGRAGRFQFQRADATLRARIGEGFLLSGRYEGAQACFSSAASRRPDDVDLRYLAAATLAAVGRAEEALEGWRRAVQAGKAPAPRSFALQRLTDRSVATIVEAEAIRLAAASIADPTGAAAHRRLGRHLLAAGSARPAAIELSLAYGISRESNDLVSLAEGYEAMGAVNEARDAYRRALEGDLDEVSVARVRERLNELGGAPGE